MARVNSGTTVYSAKVLIQRKWWICFPRHVNLLVLSGSRHCDTERLLGARARVAHHTKHSRVAELLTAEPAWVTGKGKQTHCDFRQ